MQATWLIRQVAGRAWVRHLVHLGLDHPRAYTQPQWLSTRPHGRAAGARGGRRWWQRRPGIPGAVEEHRRCWQPVQRWRVGPHRRSHNGLPRQIRWPIAAAMSASNNRPSARARSTGSVAAANRLPRAPVRDRCARVPAPPRPARQAKRRQQRHRYSGPRRAGARPRGASAQPAAASDRPSRPPARPARQYGNSARAATRRRRQAAWAYRSR